MDDFSKDCSALYLICWLHPGIRVSPFSSHLKDVASTEFASWCEVLHLDSCDAMAYFFLARNCIPNIKTCIDIFETRGVLICSGTKILPPAVSLHKIDYTRHMF